METTKVVFSFFFANALICIINDFRYYRCSIFVWQMSQITNLKRPRHISRRLDNEDSAIFFSSNQFVSHLFSFLSFPIIFLHGRRNSPVVDDTMLVNTTTTLLTAQHI